MLSHCIPEHDTELSGFLKHTVWKTWHFSYKRKKNHYLQLQARISKYLNMLHVHGFHHDEARGFEADNSMEQKQGSFHHFRLHKDNVKKGHSMDKFQVFMILSGTISLEINWAASSTDIFMVFSREAVSS